MKICLESFSSLLELAETKKTLPRTHSGETRPGDTFVLLPPAVAGGKGGLDFLQEAILGGARHLVCAVRQRAALETLITSLDSSAPEIAVIFVEDCRTALGALARAAFSSPAPDPLLCGITGTNGKTSSTFLLEWIFAAAGHKVGVLGTVNYRWPGVEIPSSLTTPGCLELHSLLARMREDGTDAVFMEVSSHALTQQRVAGLSFQGALWTNLTQDHLDFHPDMEHYYQSKARLFRPPDKDGIPAGNKVRAINSDDAYGRRLLAECAALPGQTIAYGLQDQAETQSFLQGTILSFSPEGLRLSHKFQGQSWEIRSPLVGRFNVLNLLGVEALALGLGLKAADCAALEAFSGVPGRLEHIANDRNLRIFVDYAHTPDALENALTALRDAGFRRIITVFGCGGNRDRTKRPLMGRVVSRLSDVAVVTSDNPRQEDPLAIIQDILPGMDGSAERHVRPDRREATALALDLLRPGNSLENTGDVLLVAGKGHENYTIIGDKKIFYSDQAVLRGLLGIRN